MPQLLLELFSEDIPARMQAGAEKVLESSMRAALGKAGLLGAETFRSFSGPRRLTLVVDDLPARQPERLEERKGPRVGAPEAALSGFLRSSGLTREALAERGGVWFATLTHPGRPTSDVIAEIVPALVAGFSWPKSMTWGFGSLRWVRPLHRILCAFDGQIVPFTVGDVESDDMSEGHRYMGPRTPFRARDFAAYAEALAAHFVVLDAAERKDRILRGARRLCVEKGLVLVEDQGLLDELAGMAEWPTPLMGAMDAAFLALPPEVIRTSMRTHQRYFAVGDETGKLAPHFVAVADIEASDGGVIIAAGNARVLAARLADARFFWDEDRRTPLERRLKALEGMAFHAGLGTMRERAERIAELAGAIAPMVGVDPALATQAGRLAKADLTTAMVGEFPELQGIMGGYYARAEGLDDRIADAVAEHYRPQGPSDPVPTSPLAAAVALADKMDSILGFFSIDERPTGSRDPFALRRACLGVIRIILEGNLRLSLRAIIDASRFEGEGVIAFFAERLKVLLRDRGAHHDLVDAVFALGDDDLARVVVRIEVLAAFLDSADGANLLVGYRRARNILEVERRKGELPEGLATRPDGPAEEQALFDVLAETGPRLTAAMANEDFAAALAALAAIRGPVDAFFGAVLVNSPAPAERDNRLRLLGEVCAAMGRAADFSLVSG